MKKELKFHTVHRLSITKDYSSEDGYNSENVLDEFIRDISYSNFKIESEFFTVPIPINRRKL